MPDLLAGSTVRALDTPPPAFDFADASFDLTSTSYTTTATGGAYEECAVVFIAPTSGRVKISVGARLINTGVSGTMVCPETRAGAVIGSGSIVDAVGDRGPSHYGSAYSRASSVWVISGLTAGGSYNTRVLHKVTGNAGSVALRVLIVEPTS